MKVEVLGKQAQLDYVISLPGIYGRRELIAMSCYGRSKVEVGSVLANINLGYAPSINCVSMAFPEKGAYKAIYAKVQMAHESCWQGFIYKVDTQYMVSTLSRYKMDIFNHLMTNDTLPLEREWAEPIANYLLEKGYISLRTDVVIRDNEHIGEPIPEIEAQNEGDVVIVHFPKSFTSEALRDVISTMLKKKLISIAEEEQLPITKTSQDDYFAEYGPYLVEKTQQSIHPIVPEVDGTVDTLAFAKHRLFAKQADAVRGIAAFLREQNNIILNMGMGSGKTKISLGAIESYFVKKYLRVHPSKTLKDVYSDWSTINYRVVVMAPGHLLEKWAAEIKAELPMAKVTIVTSITQLLALKKRGAKRDGREFYILSKDFAKLGTMEAPQTTKTGIRPVYEHICGACGKGKVGIGKVECQCGENDWRLVKVSGRDREYGMICPDCDNLLMPNVKVLKTDLSGETVHYPLIPEDFKAPLANNRRCYYCGSSMWGPQVKNIGKGKEKKWLRYSHFKNAAKKTKTSVWLFRGRERNYADTIDKTILASVDELERGRDEGCRKYAPAQYIKRYMKGFFDVAVFDEAHKYKGETGQGMAMHSILSVVKKSLSLTGTIAGGYASDMFYLLYRLYPRMMKDAGFGYRDIRRFSEAYGNSVTEYETRDGGGRYNAMSRGKVTKQLKEVPGISPLVSSKFLLNNTVFLDITDMSNQLPPLHEYIELVNMEDDIRIAYNQGVRELQQHKDKEALKMSMLRFALTYPDKPYGIDAIISPKTGKEAMFPDSLDEYRDKLHAKERHLVSVVTKELSEGRNCFVFCEATGEGSARILERLKGVLEKEVPDLEGHVAIIEASSPAAAKREEHLHKLAKAGYRVVICNPSLVETGMDFKFEYEGIVYNYPTIVFYQMGYSLFTLWQSSCRHYRLNQTEECRTYYIAFNGTLQCSVIELMASKKNAVAALQGRFSSEGLASMSQGIDVQAALVKSLAEGVSNSNKLRNMFDNINRMNDESAERLELYTMPLIKELIGEVKYAELYDGANVAMQDAEPDIGLTLEEYFSDFEESGSESEGKGSCEKSTAKTSKVEANKDNKEVADKGKRKAKKDLFADIDMDAVDSFEGSLFFAFNCMELKVQATTVGRKLVSGQLSLGL